MKQEYLSAAAKLLDREIPEESLAEWTEILSAKSQRVETSTRSAMIFRAGSEWLALPTSAVQEVAEATKIHTLPNRRAGARIGLVNVRGELVLSASLDVLLGLEAPAAATGRRQSATADRLIICSYNSDRLALPVTEIATIYKYAQQDMRNVPATMAKSATCTLGVLHWQGKTVGCLDIERLFQSLKKCFE